MTTYAFLVVMLFSAGATSPVSMWNHPCDDWACVEDVIEQTKESKTLVRLRVYEGPTILHSVTNIPMGTPKLDLWFQ